jgi:hypothetical protein
MSNFAGSKHVCHEKNISAIQQEKKEQTRIQGADVLGQRSFHHRRQKKEGPKETYRFRRNKTQGITASHTAY